MRAGWSRAGRCFAARWSRGWTSFFVARSWTGTPEIREPHKCTELVWAGPDDLPVDALDFVGQAITNARTGRHFYEYGWETAAVQTTG